MSTLSLAKQAVRIFKHKHTDKNTYRHNARMWLRSVSILGDNWVLAEDSKFSKAWVR